jgi:hypothetical protein
LGCRYQILTVTLTTALRQRSKQSHPVDPAYCKQVKEKKKGGGRGMKRLRHAALEYTMEAREFTYYGKKKKKALHPVRRLKSNYTVARLC